MSKRTIFIPITDAQSLQYFSDRLVAFRDILDEGRDNETPSPPGREWKMSSQRAIRTTFAEILAWIEGNGYGYRVQMMPYKRQLKFVFKHDTHAALFKMFFG